MTLTRAVVNTSYSNGFGEVVMVVCADITASCGQSLRTLGAFRPVDVVLVEGLLSTFRSPVL
jgi:hypothetical protein